MKVVKEAGIDTRPVVNCHDEALGALGSRYRNHYIRLSIRSEGQRGIAVSILDDFSCMPPANFANLRAHTVINGRFVLVRPLATGLVGEVWHVLDANDAMEKALKLVIHPTDSFDQRGLSERTLAESYELMTLYNNHPFVIAVYAVWLENDRLISVMELADGTLLECLLRQNKRSDGRFPASDLVRFFGDIAEGLDYLHSNGIIHRGVVPDNFLCVGNHAKIGGFSLLARAGIVQSLGCAGHIAPELWNERGSPRSDQYALAVSYAEMRQGQSLIAGTKLIDYYYQAHQSGRMHLDSAVIAGAEREIVLKALSIDPAKRFSSCREFIGALWKAERARKPV